MKKILLFFLCLLLLLFLFLLFNTWNFKSEQLQVAAVEKTPTPLGAVDRFVEAISIRTISFGEVEDFDSTQFRKFNEFLVKQYPTIHRDLEHQTFNEFSHLYKWKGQKEELKPMVLVGHFDVVPIASLRAWTVHPFTEGVKQDTVYGRGTLDDKFSVIGILEAVEQLLKEGYQPQRSIYLAFGHDEELLGDKGAVQIVKHLKETGVQAHFVLDEGQAITKGMVPGVAQNTALIGIAEKGFISLELIVNMAGGHSSMPAKETSIDVLSAAVSKLKKHPFPAKLTPVMEGFMDKLGPEMDFKAKFVFANRAIFKSLLLREFEKTASGNANIRTTTSPTIFEAGIKENVIPTTARAVVNFRIIPGETGESVLAYTKKVIDDPRILIEPLNASSNPSPVSPVESPTFEGIERSIKEVFPNVLSSPSLVVGATDARHYSAICENVYRFSPFHIHPKNITCFHGIDERVGVSEFEDGIRFYRRAILNGSK